MAARKTPRKVHLRRAEQMRELVSPLRMEIIAALNLGRPMTVAEIAHSLERPPGALYYHVRRLEQAGVIRQAGKRPAVKKHEALYEPAAQLIEIGIDEETGHLSEHAYKAAHSTLRLAKREFDNAGDEGLLDAAPFPCGIMRAKARLTAKTLKEIGRHITAIHELLNESAQTAASSETNPKRAAKSAHAPSKPLSSPRRGRLYSVTTIVLPLEGSSGKESTRSKPS